MPEDWEVEPVLSRDVAQQGVADAAGTIQYQPGVTSETGGDVAFAGPIADFILYGVVNGAFAQGPPDSTQNIDPINNPLPYWTGPVQVSGGAITCSWVADSASPSGYNLRFTIAPGAAGDEAFVEQIVPIGNDRERRQDLFFRATYYRVVATSGTVLGTSSAQYLTASGSTTGAEYTGSTPLSSDATANVESLAPTAAPPSDAAFVRIRFGVRRNTLPTSGTATIDLTNVRIDKGGGTVLVSEQTLQDTYAAGQIYQGDGSIQLDSPNDAYIRARGAYTNGRIFLENNNGVRITELSTSSTTPGSGYYSIYAKTDGILYGKNDAGTETALGGGSAWDTTITKASDESVATSTVLQNDDDFEFTTVNLAHYAFEMDIVYVNTVGNTGDLKMVFGEDTNNRGACQSIGIGAADTATTQTAVTDQTETIILGAATGERTAVIRGAFRGAGGTWRLKWAQNASSGTTKILTGSAFRYRRIV